MATEFVIVIFPMLLLVMGIMQLSLLFTADILVRHAAFAAARSAIVVLPQGAPRPDDAPEIRDSGGTGPPMEGPALSSYTHSARHRSIRHAAAYVMTPVSPAVSNFLRSAGRSALVRDWILGSFDSLSGGFSGRLPTRVSGRAQTAADSVDRALDAHAFSDRGDDSWLGALAVGAEKYAYAAFATSVVFPDGRGGYRTDFSPKDLVRVRVTYLYPCTIPIANRVACSRFWDLPRKQRLEISYGNPTLAGTGLPGYFRIFQAEAALPNQGV